VFILAEESMERSGILYHGGGIKSLVVPAQADVKWIATQQFQAAFNGWAKEVRARRDVFMGYCSKANATALAIRNYLEGRGFSVLDWSRDFAKAGPTILEEMRRAASTCRCAIFLFTKDDQLEGEATAKAVPRDNVVLEAGYFIQARGEKRVAIVRAQGTKMPADLGGVIYLSLEDESSLPAVQERLAQFLSEGISRDPLMH
jgi:predicted nucleotide-binding protein